MASVTYKNQPGIDKTNLESLRNARNTQVSPEFPDRQPT